MSNAASGLGDLPGATIYLAEATIADSNDLIKPGQEFVEVPLDPGLGVEGRLLIGRYETRAPDWFTTVATIADRDLPTIETQLAGALLLIRLANRWFAIAFGQGRHLLRQEVCVDDFGLRVAANTVNPSGVRSLDSRRFERGVILTRRQGSQPSRAEGLGLEVDRDVLSAIAGLSRRPGEGRIHGRKSLTLARDIDLSQLQAFGRVLLADYGSRDFVDGFPTLERLMAEPKDSPTVVRLEAQLLRALGEPDQRGAYFAPPSILDWERVSGFRFNIDQPRDYRRDDASLEDYLALRPNPSVEDLANDELRVVDRNSQRAIDGWPVHRWLVWETEFGDDSYVLSEGRWYKVVRDHRSLPRSDH